MFSSKGLERQVTWEKQSVNQCSEMFGCFFQSRVWKKTIPSRKCCNHLATGLICEILKREKVIGMKVLSLAVSSRLCLISIWYIFLTSFKFLCASLHRTRKLWRQKVCKPQCAVSKDNTIGEFISPWTKQTVNWNPTLVSKAFHTCRLEMDFPKFCYLWISYYQNIFFRFIDFQKVTYHGSLIFIVGD